MQVFLSWSGTRSRFVAKLLHGWLPQVIQAVEPWMSSELEKGRKWGPEIAERLGQTSFGVICLTRDNLEAPWILFESGALSKTPDALVWTFLFELSPTDVQQPLAQFQHTVAEKEDIRKLLHTINRVVGVSGEKALAEGVLDKVFETFWPELEKGLATLPIERTPRRGEMRTDRELLEEVLQLTRSQEQRLTLLEGNRFSPLSPVLPWSDEEISRFNNSRVIGRWPPPGLRLWTTNDEFLDAVTVFIKGTHQQGQALAAYIRQKFPSAWVDMVTGPEVQWEIRISFAEPQEQAKLQLTLRDGADATGCEVSKATGWTARWDR